MAPGSLTWLLRHDLRVAWREAAAGYGRLGGVGAAVVAVAALAVTHVGAWDLAGRFGAMASDPARRPEAAALALPFAGAMLLLLLAQSVVGTTKLLYGRGDLELILSAPVSPRRVLAARSLAVALGAFASVGVFVLPIADAAAARGHLRLLAIYPALAAGAALAEACALALTLALFRLVGARRTRVAGQLMATGAFAAIVFAARAPHTARGPAVAPPWPLSAPVEAAMGATGALALWMTFGAVALATAAWALGPEFRRSVEATAGIPSRRRGGARPARLRGFPRSPLGAIRAKEWRLIARDPWLVSQVGLQVLSIGSLVALLWSGSGEPALALAPAIAAVSFQLGSALAWLSLSGEDAPDLLASAPVPAGALRRGKREAVAVLVLAAVGLPLLWLATMSVATALAVLGLAAAALSSALAVQMWHVAPARRSRFAARHRESKLMGIVEVSLSVLFGLSGFLAAVPSVWSFVPLGLAGGLVLALRPRGASAGRPR